MKSFIFLYQCGTLTCVVHNFIQPIFSLQIRENLLVYSTFRNRSLAQVQKLVKELYIFKSKEITVHQPNPHDEDYVT